MWSPTPDLGYIQLYIAYEAMDTLYCENYELCQIRIAMNLTGVLIRELSIKIDNPYTALAANSNILSFITIVNRIN